jgi:polyphosphate kinase 2
MKRAKYEKALRKLQVQLCHLQRWVKEKGLRVVVVFEGRDGAGKGGTIRAITERLSPRVFRVVALPAPSDREKTQVYMQRYLQHFPAAGEVVIFDRSWYNRAGVEYVMGFCTEEEHQRFLELCPQIEKFLVEGGILLVKLWLEVSNDEQQRRFEARVKDPLRQWKLSPMDLPSRALVRLLTRARSDAEEDRYSRCALVHRPLGRQEGGAAEHDSPLALEHTLQEAARDESEAPDTRDEGRVRRRRDDRAAPVRGRAVLRHDP